MNPKPTDPEGERPKRSIGSGQSRAVKANFPSRSDGAVTLSRFASGSGTCGFFICSHPAHVQL